MTRETSPHTPPRNRGKKLFEVEQSVAASTPANRTNTRLYRLASQLYQTARTCWLEEKDTESAEEMLLAAIESCDRYTGQRREMPHMRIAAINMLTMLYHRLGRLADAERTMLLQLEAERALAAKNGEVYTENVAVTLWYLGNLYVEMHRDRDAEKAYLEALELRSRFDDEDIYRYRPATAQCHRSLGNLYFSRLNDPDTAERHYRAAVSISEELCEDEYERCNHIRGLAMSLRLLAAFYEESGRKELAQPIAERAAALEAEFEIPLPFDMPADSEES